MTPAAAAMIGVAPAWSQSAAPANPPPLARAADEADLSPIEWLGKRIFEDRNLSEPRGQACASCHDARTAFQGRDRSANPSVASGARPGALGVRNVPTLMYASFSPAFGFVEQKNEDGESELDATGGQFLDGRASDLVAQVEGPLMNPIEMNNPSKAAVVAKARAADYAPLAREVFGADAFDDPDRAFASLSAAIAAFENTERFHPFESKFDAYLRGEAELSPEEEKGFALFKDSKKGNCLSCHAGKEDSKSPQDWLFTDFTYDNLGAPRNPTLPENADPGHFDLGLCKQPGIEKIAPKEVKVEELCGAFKVPTLRDVAVTGPYMHNGYFASLRDVVKFYVTRDTNPELWYPKGADGAVAKFNDLPIENRDNVNTKEVPYDRKPGEAPRLSEVEIDAVVAFLETLTDARYARRK